MILKDILARGKEATLPAYEQVRRSPKIIAFFEGPTPSILDSKTYKCFDAQIFREFKDHENKLISLHIKLRT